jgi:short-subunit dehydrogenase
MQYQRALVTGASSGIGAALARRLAAQGTSVVLCARRGAHLDAVAGEIREAGGQARVQTLDVGDTEHTVTTIRALDGETGGFDLIIANAGIGATNPGRTPTWESMATMLRVNFDGALATLTAVLPDMVARRRGHLVGVSSLAAFGPLPRSAGYCASKAGLSMFMEALRLDLRGTGVRVTAIHPGFVRTPMTAANPFPMPFLLDLDDAIERIMAKLPEAPATIDFPLALAAAAWLGGRLPRPVRDLALRHGPMAR